MIAKMIGCVVTLKAIAIIAGLAILFAFKADACEGLDEMTEDQIDLIGSLIDHADGVYYTCLAEGQDPDVCEQEYELNLQSIGEEFAD